jgi:hypothetical protein
MAVRISTGLRNHILGTDDVAAAFAGGILKIFSGAQPTAADDAEQGTLIAEMDPLPSPAFAAPAAGSMAKTGTWEDAAANAAGDMGWGRIMEQGDAGGSSATQKRIDFSVTVTAGGGNVTFPSVTVGAGDPVSISTLTVTMPAS